MAESIGAFAKLGVDSTRICFARLLNRSRYTLTYPEGVMCGNVDDHAELVSLGPRVFAFELVCWPTPEELDVLLPLMWFTESPADTFTITSTATPFTLVVGYPPKVHTYTGCLVDRWIFRGSSGRQPISLQLTILGVDESLGDAFGPVSPTRTAPYAFQTASLSILGQSRRIDRFAVACENNLLPSFYNSPTATSISITERRLFFGFTTPYTADELDIYTHATSDSTRAAGTNDLILSIVRGGQSTVFTPAAATWEASPPSIFGKRDRIQLDQYWRAYRTVSAPLLVVTHDSTI